MRVTAQDGQEPFTTVAGYKLKTSRVLFLRGRALLRNLKRLPGLKSAALFRSYDRRSVMVYLQWSDQASAESGLSSKWYEKCLTSLGKNIFPSTLCEITFVDDARPVQDHLKAATFTSKEIHTTLIGTFEVEPARREELLDLLRRDHSFLREFDGFVSVAFHKAVHAENVVIEVLQFRSPLKLRAVAKTPRGAAHLAAVEAVGKVTAILYRLSRTS